MKLNFAKPWPLTRRRKEKLYIQLLTLPFIVWLRIWYIRIIYMQEYYVRLSSYIIDLLYIPYIHIDILYEKRKKKPLYDLKIQQDIVRRIQKKWIIYCKDNLNHEFKIKEHLYTLSLYIEIYEICFLYILLFLMYFQPHKIYNNIIIL